MVALGSAGARRIPGSTRSASFVRTIEPPGISTPAANRFMVNYRVRDLDDLVERRRAAGETLAGSCVERDEGRFAWMLDPDGQKVELWEPSSSPPAGSQADGPVEGIGGVFFRSPKVAELKAWYAEIGVVPGEDGYVTFPQTLADGTLGFTAWEIFPHDTLYFDSGGVKNPHPFMVNFRVRGLDKLLDGLRADGVWVDPNIEAYDFGNFGWIVDPTGARVELWELLADSS